MSDIIAKPNKPSPSHLYTALFLWTEWCMSWVAYSLNKLAILKVLEIAGKATVLVAIIFWFCEAPQRKMEGIRSAWIVINSASGLGGDGGRIDAIEYLAKKGVCLDGLCVPRATLYGLQVPNCSIQGADFRETNLHEANFKKSILIAATFNAANLYKAKFNGCILWLADFRNAYIPFTDFTNADLPYADFRDADLGAIELSHANIKGANLRGVKNITPSRIKTAKNWEQAVFDDKMRKHLKLPPNYLDGQNLEWDLPPYILPLKDSEELDRLEKDVLGSDKR